MAETVDTSSVQRWRCGLPVEFELLQPWDEHRGDG